jgi:cytidyltransferase-like protein
MDKTICISGGFDPLHRGHLAYIQGATEFGKVIVILNSDDWLIRKKGYALLDWRTRHDILTSLRNVALVVPVADKDDSVCQALEAIRPDFFGNGGDRKEENTLELNLCKSLNIVPVFGLGGYWKLASSSKLMEAACHLMK